MYPTLPPKTLPQGTVAELPPTPVSPTVPLAASDSISTQKIDAIANALFMGGLIGIVATSFFVLCCSSRIIRSASFVPALFSCVGLFGACHIAGGILLTMIEPPVKNPRSEDPQNPSSTQENPK